MENLKDETNTLLDLLSRAESITNLPDSTATDPVKRQNIAERLKKLTCAVQTPIEQAWDVFQQPHHLSALQTALDAGWLAAINNSGGEGITALAIASQTGHDVLLIRRLLRYLATTGNIREVAVDTYSPTAMSEFFATPAIAAGVRHCGHDFAVAVSTMPEFFANNGYWCPPSPKYGIYAHAYGQSLFRYLAQRPDAAREFNKFMESAWVGKKSWFDVYPVASLEVESDEETVLVDVGGGQGHETARLAGVRESLGLKGRLVLQDTPEVVATVDEASRELFEAMPHDFFRPQPASTTHAKTYYMRHILHDWPDKDCITILLHLRGAMKPGYSTLLINEIVLPDIGISNWSAAFDISMMAVLSGRERTMSDWNRLFSAVGALKLIKCWELDSQGETVLEVVLE